MPVCKRIYCNPFKDLGKDPRILCYNLPQVPFIFIKFKAQSEINTNKKLNEDNHVPLKMHSNEQ